MESMSFKRGLKSKDALKIGINYLFWFGNYNGGIEKNDGINSMWIDKDFLESLDIIKGYSIRYLNYTGKYSRDGVKCQESYIVNLISYYDEKEAYLVNFYGSYYTRTRKSLYKQLYNHLLEKL